MNLAETYKYFGKPFIAKKKKKQPEFFILIYNYIKKQKKNSLRDIRLKAYL